MSKEFRASRRQLLAGAVYAGLASFGSLMPGASIAQQRYPNRPLRFVVPFGAGSATDVIARVYAQAVAEVMGQSVVVDNRPGANGIIGANAVLNAPADGYTVFFASNSTLTTNAAVIPDLPYDPLRDFEPISVLDGGYCTLVVPVDSPYQTVEDLIADARKRPGELNNAAGSPTYGLWNAWFNEINQIETTNIFYKGSGEAVNAAVSGHVDYSIVAVIATASLVAGGRLRALLYSGKTRHAQLSSVPTSKEAGMPDFDALAWSAVAMRAGTPEPILRELERVFAEVASRPEVQKRIAQLGSESLYVDAAGMRRFLTEEIERWKRLVAATGISMQ